MKRVAIIGAGPAGIVAVKTTKEYGHHVACFEKEAGLGGTWDISGEKKEIPYETLKNKEYGISSGYNQLLMNTSAGMSEFSDFPVEKPLHFSTHAEYLDYLKQYATHFDLLRCMAFNCTVTRLEKEGREWLLHYTSLHDDHTETFDFVIIATGPFRFPVLPEMDGLASFPGLVVHSGQVRNEEMLFKDKEVLVIGTGNSSFEISCGALSSGAKKVYMEVPETTERRSQFTGTHYKTDPRQNGHLIPYDTYVVTWSSRDRGAEGAQEFLSAWSKPVRKSTSPNHIFDWPFDGTVCTKVDYIDEMEAKGMFQKVPSIAKIREDQIELSGGQILSNIDIILCATGFSSRYPMLNEIWPLDEQKKCEVFRHMVPLDGNMDGLVLLAPANSLSASIMPVMEMQSRFACEKILKREYADNGLLFTDAERKEMKKEVEEEKEVNQKYQRGFNFLVDVPAFHLKLAKDMGCAPPDYKALLEPGNSLEDREFGVALYYGPIIPAQFRLSGPKPWDGAKQRIIEVAKQTLGGYFDQLMKKHSVPKE